jgi:hypothetical protein
MTIIVHAHRHNSVARQEVESQRGELDGGGCEEDGIGGGYAIYTNVS